MKTDDLLHTLTAEIETIKPMADYELKMLLDNISRKKHKAQDQTIYKWLQTIRPRKEEMPRAKSHDRSRTPTSQSTRKFCVRR